MTKKFRIIPSVQFKNGSVVKSVNYQNHRVVGDLTSTMRVYSRRQADELIFYNLDALEGGEIDIQAISACVENANMPLTYGGGVGTVEMANKLIGSGFDKISFNSVLFEQSKVVYGVAKLIGSSSTVATIDIKTKEDKQWVVTNGGKRYVEEFNPNETIQFLEDLGVGEIVINCIDHDGLMRGYQFEDIVGMPDIANIPILVSGGCSGAHCVKEAFNYGFDGAVMSSIFLWQGDSIPSLKETLHETVPVRKVVF